jgi:hypothetical protein
MYAGTDRVYWTTNGAALWVPISPDLTKDLGFYESFISAIAVSKSDPLVLYAGTSDGNFQVSTNGGGNWILRNGGLPNRFVMDITVDPENAEHVYTCVSGYDTTHVWESTDSGASWRDMSSNLPDVPVNTIVLPLGEFASPGTIYIGTDFSCFKTTDNGASWFAFANGLPNVVVEDMAFHETLGFIRAATQGRSVWDVVDTTAVYIGGEDTPRLPHTFRLHQNYPNPFNPSTIIEFDVAGSGKERVQVNLDIYDVRGRLVRALMDEMKEPGKYQIHWDGRDNAGAEAKSGIYFCRITAGDFKATRKLTLLK